MINPTEAAEKIICLMPDSEQAIQNALGKSSFELIHTFTHKIKQLCTAQQTIQLSKAIALMDEIYCEGEKSLRLAVENIFIFCIETISSKSGMDIPQGLYHAYLKQVYRSNI